MKSQEKTSSNKNDSPLASRIAISDSPPKPFDFRNVVIVLFVAWAARLAFMLFIPSGARSFDVFSWESIVKILEQGENPYQASVLLNWPPLWMQVIFCLSKVAASLGVPFFRVLQIFLILVESGVIILLFKLIQEVAPTANIRKIILIGLALNPIAILLVCQHCNFDVIVALWLMLFMISLLRYNRTNNLADWLSACLFLGLGVLTKTVPLLLIPMLAGGFRQATVSFRFLGSVLVLGPAALGMSIIYVLSPIDVTSKVLLYHSQRSIFGISGLIHMAGADDYMSIPNIVFYVALVIGMALAWFLFWRRQCIGSRETVLYAALVLAAIPTLGPGYGPQYIYWFMPFLVATYAFYSGQWRVMLVCFALLSACTYLVEYALLQEFGYNLLYVLNPSIEPDQSLVTLPSLFAFPVIQQLNNSDMARTLLRLPLFIGYLTLLAFGFRILFRNMPNLLNIRVLKRFYPLVILIVLGLALGIIGNLTESKAENGNKSNRLAMLPARDFKERMDNSMALNNLAWRLATSSDDKIRNGTLAVKLAERACELTYDTALRGVNIKMDVKLAERLDEQAHYQMTIMNGTLAAAYAEAGRFDDAISTGQKACARASELGDTNLLKKNQELVTLYQKHQPYHEPPSNSDDSKLH